MNEVRNVLVLDEEEIEGMMLRVYGRRQECKYGQSGGIYEFIMREGEKEVEYY